MKTLATPTIGTRTRMRCSGRHRQALWSQRLRQHLQQLHLPHLRSQPKRLLQLLQLQVQPPRQQLSLRASLKDLAVTRRKAATLLQRPMMARIRPKMRIRIRRRTRIRTSAPGLGRSRGGSHVQGPGKSPDPVRTDAAHAPSAAHPRSEDGPALNPDGADQRAGEAALALEGSVAQDLEGALPQGGVLVDAAVAAARGLAAVVVVAAHRHVVAISRAHR